jgi:hypothetical protein
MDASRRRGPRGGAGLLRFHTWATNRARQRRRLATRRRLGQGRGGLRAARRGRARRRLGRGLYGGAGAGVRGGHACPGGVAGGGVSAMDSCRPMGSRGLRWAPRGLTAGSVRTWVGPSSSAQLDRIDFLFFRNYF